MILLPLDVIKISKNDIERLYQESKSKGWQNVDQRDTSVDVSPNFVIAKAIETGLITDKESVTIISQGKETPVFCGLNEQNQWVAVKLYKLCKSTHRSKLLHTPNEMCQETELSEEVN